MSSARIQTAITVIALLMTALIQWGNTNATLHFANEWLRDQFIQLQVSDAPEPRVLVVDIDEASLTEIGPWPWAYGHIADLSETLLSTYQAQGVALDILLTNPGSGEGDKRLVALANHGPLVMAQAFDYQAGRPAPLEEGKLAGAITSTGPLPAAVPATGYLANHPLFSQARHVGNIGFIPDPDGVLRRVPLLTSYNGHLYPALTLALLRCCGAQTTAPLAQYLPQGASLRIPYVRDWSAYTVVSAADILAERIDPAEIAGRLVVVGSSSMGLGDRVATPLAANRPGLSVQATVLSALLDQQAGLQPRAWPGNLIGFMYAALTALLAHIAFQRRSAALSVALLAGSGLLWLALAYVACQHDPDMSSTAPLATILTLLALGVPFQWHVTQRRSRYLLGTLRQYVAPEVVEQLLRSDVKDPLAPQRADITTLIADMQGYTSQVESLSVEEAATLTRDFLDCLTAPVIAHHGTLDKYTGDGLVAFWGAPLPMRQHADQALDAAREIVQRVERLSEQRQQQGKAPLRVRIGIESGEAMAGDFGTSFRSIYTAVGDSVNTASRLEQVARDFPHDVIIGAGCVERATRHQFIALGERRLRGKEVPTAIYTLNRA